MQTLAEWTMLVTCAIAVVVGLRTLWIFSRSLGVAELAIGTNVLSVAIGGAILTMLGAVSEADAAVRVERAYQVGLVFLALHLFAIYFGTWWIFRPRSWWAAALCLGVLVPIGLWLHASSAHAGTVWVRPILFQVLRGVGMTWSAFECFHYSDVLRRRATLGLAEPMMAHRFWLWALGATSALVVCTMELVSWGLRETSFAGQPVGLAVTAVLGFVGASAVALAFFPPRAYVRFVAPRLGDAGRPPRAAGDEAG